MILSILGRWSEPSSVSFAIGTHFNCYSSWPKKICGQVFHLFTW